MSNLQESPREDHTFTPTDTEGNFTQEIINQKNLRPMSIEVFPSNLRLSSYHIGMKVVVLLIILLARKDAVGAMLCATLMSIAEHAALRICSGRKLVGMQWYTVIDPHGKMTDYYQPSSVKEHNKCVDKLGCKLLWTCQILAALGWFSVSITYLCAGTPFGWTAFSILSCAAEVYDFIYYSKLRKYARDALVEAVMEGQVPVSSENNANENSLGTMLDTSAS